jgi:predicted ATPase/DNA-binding SARP family transcriptional activator
VTRHEFRILGALEVTSDAGDVDLGAPRQRALLALLALNGNRVVPRDRIIDALWGDAPPRTARNSLQVAVHGLRKALGADRVERRGTGYRLALRAGELDLERFSELVERAAEEDPARASETLREALALHRGTALSDLPEAPFVVLERERIEELRLVALERRIEADLQVGRHDQLVAELEALAAEHPYRERLRAQLMLALVRSGRQAEALDAFRAARRALVDGLGVEPARELHHLHAAILRQDESLNPPPIATEPATRLPVPARPLVGRALELAAITALVREAGSRLVTITGTGGTGKTRLALEVARGLLPELDGRVYFVDLSPLAESALVGPTIARALGVRDAEGDALVTRMEAAVGPREALLVVDNVEHVLECAPFVAELLARVPRARILATSREPLRIAAEREYRAPPLELPRRGARTLEEVERSEAVALFLARARSAQPGFVLARENVQAVVGICRALDGLPLALELAAARLKLLAPDALLERLEDRLGVLADGDRDLPDRQRTLRATLDWSYRLLAPKERSLLARLAVFAGGWTLEAAEEVAGADLGTLGSLVEKSLVHTERVGGEEPRFSMLETVREYALERLLETGDTGARARHAAYFAGLAERLEHDLHTAGALDEAEREHDNVRAALEVATGEGDTTTALRLCAIARLWYVRGYATEGRLWLERSLASGEGDPLLRARALYWFATLAWTKGDPGAALEPAAQALAIARAAGDTRSAMRGLMALGLAHMGVGDLLASRACHAESLELGRELGDERAVAMALVNLADIAFMLGEYAEAEAQASASLEVSRRLGDEEVAGIARLELGAVAVAAGDLEAAVQPILEALRSFRRIDFKDFLASSLVALARVRAPSDPARAARLVGAARAIRAPLGPAQFPWEESWVEEVLNTVRPELGERGTRAEIIAGESGWELLIEEELAEDRR